MSSESDRAFQEGGGNTHHFSDIDVWKHPDRSYYLFITLSILFGFFGIDHFYIRSFGTGTQKLLFNLVTFGLWYFWDLVQIIFDGQKVRTEGLDSPFEWIRGIGRGVFIDPQERLKMMADPSQPVIRSKKDLVIYALLTIMFGIFGFDKLYMGHPWQAVTKFLSVFNILFFLFGLMWVVWDIVHVVFYPDLIIKDGISPPLPYSTVFDTIKTRGDFIPELVTKAQLELETLEARQAWSPDAIKNSKFWIWNWSIWFWNWKLLGGGSTASIASTATTTSGPLTASTASTAGASTAPSMVEGFRNNVFRPLYKELVVPVIQPSVVTGLKAEQHGEEVLMAAVNLGRDILDKTPKIVDSVTEKIASLSNPDTLIDKIKAEARAKANERLTKMVGGAIIENDNIGPIIAGTLSAIVLAGSTKVIFEILSRNTV
jgi:TM2 domain-containing membrane protein YozV